MCNSCANDVIGQKTYGIFITYDKQHLYFLKCIQKSLQVQSLVLLETFVVGITANQSYCLLLFSTDILMIFYSKCFMTINFGQLFIILYRKLDCSYSEFRWKWEQRFLFLYFSSPCFKNHLI